VQNAIAILSDLGASVEEVSLPITNEYATLAGNIITWSEAAQVHTPWLDQLEDYTAGTVGKVLVGLVIPSSDYHKAQRMRRLVDNEFTQVLKKVDVLVQPVSGSPPGLLQPPAGAPGESGAARMASSPSMTRPYNLTGMPAVSVPCGFSPQGLPVGLQIAGRLFEDATVLKVAHAYEQATNWHTMHPSLDKKA
jgi:aspartyl-tRNA(Asn)/glutamyl-tRNA(Gln) amidotransferase subunit A